MNATSPATLAQPTEQKTDAAVWTVGTFGFLASGSDGNFFRIYAVVQDTYGIFGGKAVVCGQDVRFHSDTKYGRISLLSPGWIGPFNTVEMARSVARNYGRFRESGK